MLKPDGSIVVQLGPGDATAFTGALHTLLATPKIKALGPEPAVTIVRVPVGQAGFTAAMNALLAALPQLKKQGFVFARSEPDILAGKYDVAFSAAPIGMTTAAATTELQGSVSPLIQVISLDAAPVQFADREHDSPPFDGSDLIHDVTTGGFCTAGFAIIGSAGAPRGSTAAHCNAGAQGNQTFTNQGYTINGFNPAPAPTRDKSTPVTFGTTSNWQYNSLPGADIELLDQSGDPYAPLVWVGQGMSAPNSMPVGEAVTTVPMPGTSLTFDGAYSRTHRWMAVISSNSTVCVGESYYDNLGAICELIQTNLYSSQLGQWPGPAVQGG